MERDPEKNGVLQACEALGIRFVWWGPPGMGYLTGRITATTKLDRRDGLIMSIPCTGMRRGRSSLGCSRRWLPVG